MLDEPKNIIDTMGFHPLFSLLKLGDLRMNENEVCARLPYQRCFSEGLSRGIARGWSTVAIDTLLGMAVYSSLKQPYPIATIDLMVDFVRQAEMGADILCRAVCDEINDGIAFMSGDLTVAGSQIKIANVSAKFAIKNTKASRPLKVHHPSDAPVPMPEGVPCQYFENRKADMPYLRWLDPACYMAGDDKLFVLLFNETQIGDPQARAVHGGILASLLEIAASEAITGKTAPTATPCRLISQSIEFLRPTNAQHTFSSAKIIRRGALLVTIDATVWQHDEEKPAARGRFLFSGER